MEKPYISLFDIWDVYEILPAGCAWLAAVLWSAGVRFPTSVNLRHKLPKNRLTFGTIWQKQNSLQRAACVRTKKNGPRWRATLAAHLSSSSLRSFVTCYVTCCSRVSSCCRPGNWWNSFCKCRCTVVSDAVFHYDALVQLRRFLSQGTRTRLIFTHFFRFVEFVLARREKNFGSVLCGNWCLSENQRKLICSVLEQRRQCERKLDGASLIASIISCGSACKGHQQHYWEMYWLTLTSSSFHWVN